jgi:hypothetical protein
MGLRRSHYRAKARLLQRRSAMTWETVRMESFNEAHSVFSRSWRAAISQPR